MLEVARLKKRYGSHLVVDDVSFHVGPGECLGLLGPNGAGKTTVISIITGLLPPDEGQVRIDGQTLHGDTHPLKRKLGLVPQELALYDELTARENLYLFGALYGLSGAARNRAMDRVLDWVGLEERSREQVATYSGGMKRRLNLAAALMHEPRLLILDEPTVGVDPQSRNAIFDSLESLRAHGMTLLYVTHYMEEAERLCDHVVIMDRGKKVAGGTLPELYGLLPMTRDLRVELTNVSPGPWLDELRTLPELTGARLTGAELAVTLAHLEAAPRVLDFLAERNLHVRHLRTELPSLERVFLTLTGRTLRDA